MDTMERLPVLRMFVRMKTFRLSLTFLHAEANAITKVAKSSNSSENATLYVTAAPCIECAKLIIQAGIVRVVYSEEYHSTDGKDLLERAGIEVEICKCKRTDLKYFSWELITREAQYYFQYFWLLLWYWVWC